MCSFAISIISFLSNTPEGHIKTKGPKESAKSGALQWDARKIMIALKLTTASRKITNAAIIK